jgi:glycosyltransferase involved in cell wall biosynthesis
MEPTLTIVIPAYNVERYVREATLSALNQTRRDIEVIVVDDGSTDGTVAALAGIEDPRLRVISQANCGLSGARNTGIREARGNYIGFLDADDRWMPEKAEKHLALMEGDAGIGVTYCHSLYIDEQSADKGRILFSRSKNPTLAQMVRRNRVGNGSSPIVLAECFKRAGLFDETLRSCEDWEMWVRIMRETHFSARLVPEVLTCYRVNTDSLSMNFAPFLENAERACARVERETAGVSKRVHREGRASMYRITATKALYNDQRPKAISLLIRAFQVCPWLLLVDPRAWVTLAMLPLPQGLSASARTFVGRIVRPVSFRTSPVGPATLASGPRNNSGTPKISS